MQNNAKIFFVLRLLFNLQKQGYRSSTTDLLRIIARSEVTFFRNKAQKKAIEISFNRLFNKI